ncbi:NADP-binding protein [Gigaspora margarita]|uniref:NADP-binding protein n=1 Tax=Gigaspora margarita TaxID=4874 RepID=A0A8H4AEU7_GIGMA|nr:NADP-binding protein [Gigaspora margarita]
MHSKNSIHVSGADGDLGTLIVRNLLEMPNLHSQLPNIPIHAGVHRETMNSIELEESGALVIEVDPISQPESLVHILNSASKLLLLIDPLSGEITRKNLLAFAEGYINAAKDANVEHIIFPTPFAKIDAPYSPPLTPTDDSEDCAIPNRSYRDQFEIIESTLRNSFDASQITIIRYPGVISQHLLRFSRYICEKSQIPMIDNPNMIFECCDVSDIVRALCYILYCPVQRHGGKEYKITGPNLLTIHDIAVKASLGLGREIKVELMSIRQLQRMLMDITSNREIATYLLELWGLQGYIGASRKVQVTRDLEIITGGTGKSLREFFENNREDFLETINSRA